MPEMWARCDPCDRWFFVPFDSGERMADARCSCCAAVATGFQVRLDGSTFPVELLDGAHGAALTPVGTGCRAGPPRWRLRWHPM